MSGSGPGPVPVPGTRHRTAPGAGHPWPVLDVHVTGRDPAAATGHAVFLHGFGEDGAAMDGLAAAVLPDGWTGWAPTLRGHGARERPAWGYTPGDVAADVQRTLGADGRHAVIGFSFGGIVAGAYALAVGPEVVSGLVVLDQAFERRNGCDEDGDWAEAAHMLWHFDYRHHLLGAAALGIPVLLVHARGSAVVSEEEKRDWAGRDVPGLTVRTVDGGHTDLVRGPRTAAAEVAAFLGGLEYGGTG